MTDRIDTAKERKKLAALDSHTPGPWHDDFGETYRVKSADGMNVATMNWVTLLGRLPSSEVKANTSLIATAPDLKAKYAAALDALDAERAENRRLREVLRDMARQKRTDELETEYDVECADFEGAYDTFIDRARAALNPEGEA